MDFTAAFRHASSKCLAFSPGSTFIASVTGDGSDTVLIRASSTLQVIRSWTLDTSISELEWSTDGFYILASHPGQQEDGIVYILSLDPSKEANDGSDDDRGWVARIASGAEGLAHATWTPPHGPRTLVMFSQNQLRASLYSLSDQTISAIDGPKRDRLIWTSKRPDYFAVILKGAERDSMHIFACKRIPSEDLKALSVVPRSEELWKSEKSFNLALNDATDALWAPDGHCLAVWENILEYRLQIYTPLGHLRATFLIEPEADGEPVTRSGLVSDARGASASRSATRKQKDANELPHLVAGGGLGIREVKWHPSSKFLAVGGWDEKVRILESVEWAEMCCFDTSAKSFRASVSTADMSIYGPLTAWREPTNWLEETRARGIVALEQASLPISSTALRIDVTKSNHKFGVKWMEWSPDGNLIAAFNERMPYTIFIYAFAEPEQDGTQLPRPYLLAMLLLNSAIRRICWKPNHIGKMGVVCDDQAVYTWELIADTSNQGRDYRQRAEAIPIPIKSFKATDIRWSFDGQKILVASEDLFCCAFEAVET